MSDYLFLSQPATGKTARVKVGWSWTTLFFAPVGVPLFLRRMYVWGAGMILLSLAGLVFSIATEKPAGALTLLPSIYLAAVANRRHAKKLIADGWQVAEPTSEGAMHAKAKWGLSAA